MISSITNQYLGHTWHTLIQAMIINRIICATSYLHLKNYEKEKLDIVLCRAYKQTVVLPPTPATGNILVITITPGLSKHRISWIISRKKPQCVSIRNQTEYMAHSYTNSKIAFQIFCSTVELSMNGATCPIKKTHTVGQHSIPETSHVYVGLAWPYRKAAGERIPQSLKCRKYSTIWTTL